MKDFFAPRKRGYLAVRAVRIVLATLCAFAVVWTRVLSAKQFGTSNNLDASTTFKKRTLLRTQRSMQKSNKEKLASNGENGIACLTIYRPPRV